MSMNIRQWLNVSQEEHAEAPVHVQDGETPKEDFSTATNQDTGDVDTDTPAVADIDAASDGADKGKDVDQGHQTTHVPNGDGQVSNESADGESAPAAAEGGDNVSADAPAPSVESQDGTGGEEGKPSEALAPAEDVVIEPDEQTDAQVAKPEEAEIEPTEAGDDQKTPEADEQVAPNTDGTETNEVSQEEHADVPTAPQEDGEPAAAAAETDVTPAQEPAEDTPSVAQVESDIDHFNRVTSALERYHDLVGRSLESGEGIDSVTAEAIRIGLEALDEEEFSGEAVIPAMEAFGKTSSCATASRLANESLQVSIERVAHATERAVAYRDRLKGTSAEAEAE